MTLRERFLAACLD